MCSRCPSLTHKHTHTHTHAYSNTMDPQKYNDTLWTITRATRTVNQFCNCETITIDGDVDARSLCVYMCKRARSRAHNKGWVRFVLFFIFDFAPFQRYIYFEYGRGSEREWEWQHSTKSRWAAHDNYSKLCHRPSVSVCVCLSCLYSFCLAVDEYRNWKTVSLIMFRIHHRQSIVWMCASVWGSS